MGHPLRVGIKLSQDKPIDVFRSIWDIAEQTGFDHCWAMDHLATIGAIGDDRPIFDGWALLAAMAAATSRVRIGLLVTGVTYRNPALLAKLATTVDHLSGGRLEFGIGAGWAANEHEMYGIPGLDHRVGLLSEGLQVVKSLWTRERTDFDGRYFQMKNAVANPKPVQKPYPPIWIGASGPSTLRLVARHADVWNMTSGVAEHQKAIETSKALDEACAAIGRDPAEIRRSVQVPAGEDAGALLEGLLRYREEGFSELVVMLSGGAMPTAKDPVRTATMVAEQVLPALRAGRGLGSPSPGRRGRRRGAHRPHRVEQLPDAPGEVVPRA